jgi:hypothetical protein
MDLAKMGRGASFMTISIGNIKEIPDFHKSISTPDGGLYLFGGNTSQGKTSRIMKFDFKSR